MSDSDQIQGMSMAHRKPRISTAIDRRKVARPTKEYAMLKKTNDVTVQRTQAKSETAPVSVKMPSQKVTSVSTSATRPTAKQLKESAIEKLPSNTPHCARNYSAHHALWRHLDCVR